MDDVEDEDDDGFATEGTDLVTDCRGIELILEIILCFLNVEKAR